MNFNQPTKQAKIGIIANFIYTAQKFVRAFAPLILVFFLRNISDGNYNWIWWSLPVVLSFIMIWAILNYHNFVFYINQNTQSFVVESGVINKTKVSIQLDKIQQVNINQTFINKLVKVYSIEIDSAGSKDKEVVINSVSNEVAKALKETLLNYSNQNNTVFAEEEKSTVEKERQIRKISFLSLIKVGLTSNYMRTFSLILAFFITLYEKFFKIVIEESINEEALENFITQQISGILILFLLLFMIVSVLMVNLFRTVLKFFNFEIQIENNTLLLSYGLLNTRHTIIRPKRVQLVSVIQNYFQKKLAITGFKIKQVMGSDSQNKKTALEIPGCSPSEKEGFLKMIFGELPSEPQITLLPNYRFFVFRFFIFGLIPAFAIGMYFSQELELSILLIYIFIYLTVVSLIIYRIFKVRKMEVSDKFIKITSGFWDITETILEPNKIQKLTISQYFWQSNSNIGTLKLYTAGGTLSFETTNYNSIEELMNIFVYQVESSNEAWM